MSDNTKFFLSVLFDDNILYDIQGSSIFSKTEPLVAGILVVDVAALDEPKNTVLAKPNPIDAPQIQTLSAKPNEIEKPAATLSKQVSAPQPKLSLEPIAGQNLKKITVLLSLPPEQLAEATDFVYKLLAALAVEPSDMLVFNLISTNPIDFDEFQNRFDIKILLGFGVMPTRFSGLEPIGISKINTHKSIKTAQQVSMIFMPKTESIGNLAKEQKQELWTQIKKLFI